MPFAKIISEGQRADPFVRKCLMSDKGVVLKQMPKASFQRNFFQNSTHFNKLLYH